MSISDYKSEKRNRSYQIGPISNITFSAPRGPAGQEQQLIAIIDSNGKTKTIPCFRNNLIKNNTACFFVTVENMQRILDMLHNGENFEYQERPAILLCCTVGSNAKHYNKQLGEHLKGTSFNGYPPVVSDLDEGEIYRLYK